VFLVLERIELILKGVLLMFQLFNKLWTEESGQGMTEYGLIIALVAIAVIIALTAMGGKLSAVFDQITSKL
jgi:pilus assembly protein Flp/PilA